MSTRPNILLCLADDAGMHMGAYGCSWVKTPGFDRVAEEGVLFTHAYTPNAKCAPSRACILTGRNSWQLGEACNHQSYFPAPYLTYAEVLVENDYFVGYTAKGWAPGVPGTRNGRPRELTGRQYNQHRLDPPTSGISANDYTANFREFLDDKPADQPFCFWFGSTEPHRDYEYGSGAAKGGKLIEDIDRVYGIWPDNEVVRNDLLDYALEVEWFDRHVAAMLAILEERGELDNTIVVVTSDNGMPFPRAKGQEYEYSNHLPLAVMWRDGIRGPGRHVDDYVCFIDFAPTFLELAGVDAETAGMQPITGRSLTDVLRGDAVDQPNSERDHVLIGKERHDVGRPNDEGYPIRGIFQDNYLYLRNFETDRWPAGNPETGYLNADGSPTKSEILRMRTDPETAHFWRQAFAKRPEEELYNVGTDPDCLTNLADSPDHAMVKQTLRSRMEHELKEQDDPRMFGNGDVFDAYLNAATPVRHFYERYMAGERPPAGWVNDTDYETVHEDGQ